jgi:hypothetical protein
MANGENKWHKEIAKRNGEKKWWKEMEKKWRKEMAKRNGEKKWRKEMAKRNGERNGKKWRKRCKRKEYLNIFVAGKKAKNGYFVRISVSPG